MPTRDARLAIYIHIPFCGVRCGYCAFNTYTDLDHLVPRYVGALCRELALAAEKQGRRRVGSVYFGGGTPSRLSPPQLAGILDRARQAFAIDEDAEVSLEANPDDLNEAYARDLRRIGINRLSIGMQSANADILRMFDRQHDLAAVAAAVKSARRAHFDNINLDVIFGSPGETLESWRGTVQTLLAFAPDHVSMYGLELKGGTQLRQLVDRGELPRPDDDDFADMYEYASAALEAANYSQYEISNWRKPGKACRHNLQYWRNMDYLGMGAGAHGFVDGARYSNIAAPERYIASLAGAEETGPTPRLTPAVAKTTEMTPADDLYETIMMGLRLTQEGLGRARFTQRFSCDFVAMFPEATRRLRDAGLLEITAERARLSRSGRLLSNLVIREIVAGIQS